MGLSSSRFNTRHGFSDFSEYIGRGKPRLGDWESWEHDYCYASMAHYFSFKHIERSRPYLLVKISDIEMLRRDGDMELLVSSLAKAVERQNEELHTYTNYQGRGYW